MSACKAKTAHWGIGRGQVVLQATPFAKSGLTRLEAEDMDSEHICPDKMLLLLSHCMDPWHAWVINKPCNCQAMGSSDFS